jgi:RNA polymerase sigma-70 factor (ECF subfamily)
MRDPDCPPAADAAAADPAWSAVTRGQFLRALGELPEDLRTVFLLQALEGLSYDELAARLTLSRDQIAQRLARARALLKTALLPAGGGP